jgi:predicted small metal-binding protein
MKEFTCASLGNNCDAVLHARTEERLVEMVSLHLRAKHGVVDMLQEDVAKIKNLLTSPATPDAAYVVDRIFEKYNCDSDPDCTWRYIAEAEMILKGAPTPHARELKAA